MLPDSHHVRFNFGLLLTAANPLSNFRIQTCLRHLHIHLQAKSQTKSQTNCQALKKKKNNHLAAIIEHSTTAKNYKNTLNMTEKTKIIAMSWIF